jgi:hypothetical protein
MFSQQSRTLRVVGRVIHHINVFLHALSPLDEPTKLKLLEMLFNKWNEEVGVNYYQNLMDLIQSDE